VFDRPPNEPLEILLGSLVSWSEQSPNDTESTDATAFKACPLVTKSSAKAGAIGSVVTIAIHVGFEFLAWQADNKAIDLHTKTDAVQKMIERLNSTNL
jgi:hypothetical protein